MTGLNGNARNDLLDPDTPFVDGCFFVGQIADGQRTRKRQLDGLAGAAGDGYGQRCLGIEECWRDDAEDLQRLWQFEVGEGFRKLVLYLLGQLVWGHVDDSGVSRLSCLA